MLALPIAIAVAGSWLLSSCSLECIQPLGAAGDGYASANVQTWYDADGDGQRDAGEEALPWVTIQMSYELSMTDDAGRGSVDVFKPGCACRCWDGETVKAWVPPGYRATTPAELELKGQGLDYAFGFQVQEAVRLLSFPDEPAWFHAFLNRGLDLRAFHYTADRLSVSFNTSGDRDKYDQYRDVFAVIATLKELKQLAVRQVEITWLPSNEIVTCEMDGVEQAAGMAFDEIVASNCHE